MTISATSASTQALTPEQKQALSRLHQASTQFEAVFVDMLFREMRKTESDDTLTGKKSNADKIYGEMLDDERARSMAQSGSLGIARLVEAQLRPAVLANAAREAAASTRRLAE
ncbi:MAG: rod-binding protein [Candidatus Eremiobacteraeota bacterium]|nr:rod-binding protein [Candidatus Eremiobacteraeota bacterium]MBV8355781.1 rod-binding protein [Candidatus Eremiobacteraeota bacterium]